jgi:hypothetical protein
VVEVKMQGTYAPGRLCFGDGGARTHRDGRRKWFGRQALKRAVGFSSRIAKAAPPTALVDLAKPSYRLGIARR